MKFKVGDKVKFMNEAGGGYVSRIISPNMVGVTIEDGFELPTLTSELLKVDTSDATAKMFEPEYNIPKPEATPEEPVIESVQQRSSERSEASLINKILSMSSTAKGEELHLLFVPEDQHMLISGSVDIYLTNPSCYDLVFSYFLEREGQVMKGIDYNLCPAGKMFHLAHIDRDDLEQWQAGVFQFLFHKGSLKEIPEPLSVIFRAKLPKFYKENAYRFFDTVQKKAMVYSLGNVSTQSKIKPFVGRKKDESYKEEVVKKAGYKRPDAMIHQYRSAEGEAEVDLHAERLVNHTHRLDPMEIMRIQLDHFTRCLESAIAEDYTKVIFIHGVGVGTLKFELKKIAAEYEGIEFKDAPINKYGIGATEILIS